MDEGRLKRHNLADDEWARLAPLLMNATQGARWKDHRAVINGIFRRHSL
jgi:transposase